MIRYMSLFATLVLLISASSLVVTTASPACDCDSFCSGEETGLAESDLMELDSCKYCACNDHAQEKRGSQFNACGLALPHTVRNAHCTNWCNRRYRLNGECIMYQKKFVCNCFKFKK